MRRLAPLALLTIAACAPARSQTVEPVEPVEQARVVDLLRIDKSARTLELWAGGRLVRRFSGIQLGRAPVGAKRFEGDGKTPEGRYEIDWRNPHSAYHLSLHISYPDAQDTALARAQGRSAGGMIMIHGQPNGRPERPAGDWTDGCIGLSNAEIEALWTLVPDGATVEITP